MCTRRSASSARSSSIGRTSACKRLTPGNHDELLFDDVLWVERAQWEHDQFVARMRERGVEVLYVQDLLSEALAASEEARRRIISLVASEAVVGPSLVEDVQACLTALAPDVLARHLIGGLTVAESGLDLGQLRTTSLIAAAIDDESLFVLPPLPNSLFTRDSSCWIYGGVSINPMYWPARRREAYNMATIYRAHPRFKDEAFEYWYPELGDDERFRLEDFGQASLEGGDVKIIGKGTVAIGMSERTTGRMIEQIAKALFAKGAADRVIAAVMTKDRAHMHLDTVFTLLDRDKATAFPKVVEGIRAVSLRPGSKPGTLDVRAEKDFVSAVTDALGVPSSTWSRPAATPTSRRASNGTTATTSSRSSPVSSSPTSGTRSRSRRCARPASRSSPSRASSSARVVAAGTA